MKEYKNDQIIVYWFPEVCSHPGICLKLLPKVFNINQRPWINVNAAEPEEIIRCIDKCPSGALRYSLPEGSGVDPQIACGVGNINHEETNPAKVKIKVSGRGPLVVEGPVDVISSGGELLKAANKIVLCSCGKSGNYPFCDGSHTEQKK